jgi:hypothetical protein
LTILGAKPVFYTQTHARVGLTARIVEDGFPHSEIHGSKVVRTSPRLNAAYHVLHRLSMPRHPLNALKALDHFHYQCAPTRVGCMNKEGKTSLLRSLRVSVAVKLSIHGVANTHHDKACEAGRNSLTMSNNRQKLRKIRKTCEDENSFSLGRFVAQRWWSQTGSNRRPEACKATALPAELWPH